MQSKNSLLIKTASTVLKNIYGERLAKIILFGSYARGEQHAESDIDLLVVLNDNSITIGKEIRFINDSIFEIAFQNNISISVHPVTSKKFEMGTSFFMSRVRKEGVTL